MADPFCPRLRAAMSKIAGEAGISYHKKGTIVTIEGPCFSTRAESHMFRGFNADVIGMTTATEAILAREAGLCYATIAMATDYDVWRENTETVTWQMIFETMGQNAENAKKLILGVIPKIDFTDCTCCK
jgi:5'-methylthioadenosine phosphorylase